MKASSQPYGRSVWVREGHGNEGEEEEEEERESYIGGGGGGEEELGGGGGGEGGLRLRIKTHSSSAASCARPSSFPVPPEPG